MASDAGLRQNHPLTRGGATTVLLVRHGESTANVAAAAADAAGAETVDLPVRDADVPLTPTGVAQAEALRRWFDARPTGEYPDSVWASPYLRTVQTARIALAGRPDGARPVQDERLRDREFGVVQLLTGRGVEARMPVEAARSGRLGQYYYRPPGGESLADIVLRLRSFLTALDADDCGPTALVVSHDAVIMLFRAVCEGLTEPDILQLARIGPVLNASITRMVRADVHAPWRLDTFNDVTHLAPAGPP